MTAALTLIHPPVSATLHDSTDTSLLAYFRDLAFCYQHGFAAVYEEELYAVLAELAVRGHSEETLTLKPGTPESSAAQSAQISSSAVTRGAAGMP